MSAFKKICITVVVLLVSMCVKQTITWENFVEEEYSDEFKPRVTPRDTVVIDTVIVDNTIRFNPTVNDWLQSEDETCKDSIK